MNTFKFADKTIKICIEGKEYSIEYNSEIGDLLNQLSVEGVALAKSIADGEKSLSDAIALSRRTIDSILGNGAYADIFSNRQVDILDCTDLINFIAGEIKAFARKRTVLQNREQRRSQKAKK